MNSSPPINRRFLPTLTEVVQASELAQYRPAGMPQPAADPVPVAPVPPILQRLDEVLTQLLAEEQDDAARAVLAPKFEILKQRLQQEFNSDRDPALT